MGVLIVGARPDSLGAAVRDSLQGNGLRAVTAGMWGEEKHLDVTDPDNVHDIMMRVRPRQVVVTAGINRSFSLRADGARGAWHEHMAVNFIGVMTVLQEWLAMRSEVGGMKNGQFVAISSNSAHIARRGSLAYCASKAALSMGLRCAARETSEEGVLVYGYEPGLLAGTPMTAQAAQDFPGPLHRMPGVGQLGLSTRDFASLIASNLMHPTQALHGTMLRLDAGEQ
jgi:NAD(P)-dependent dehydrogenase (short-subunit alcohol dehydrogenase family)